MRSTTQPRLRNSRRSDYVAHGGDGILLEIVPGFGPFAISQVERDSVFRFDAGRVVHELSDRDGASWILFSFDIVQTADLDQMGSLLVGAGVAGIALRRGRARG